jgi:hypothetical protein
MKSVAFVICFSLVCARGFSQHKSLVHSKEDSSFRYAPAVTLENPLNSGKFGLIVLGATIQNKTRLGNNPDGNAGVYLGLGEPEKLIGAGATINVYGLTNKIGEQNNLGTGGLNVHINKLLFRCKLLIDAGVDNAILWGNYNDKKYISYQRSFYFSSNYILYSKNKGINNAFSYLSITGGLGNGYFRSDKNATNKESGSFNPFLSLATPIFRATSLIAEWNGYDIGIGVSSIPFQKIPFMFQLEVTDIKFGSPRIVSSVSFPFSINNHLANLRLRQVGIRGIRAARTI